MKARSLVDACFVVGVLWASTAFGQWVVRPTGTTENLYGICVRGLQGATVVGANATILYTEDDGFDWGPQTAEPTDVNYHAVSFADHDTGLVAGTSGTILFTTNAGDLWTTIETGWMHPYYAAEQATPSSGAVAGVNSVFQPLVGVTTNGWQTYDFHVFYPFHDSSNWEGTITDIAYVDTFFGYASVAIYDGQGAICETVDGGVTWQTVYWSDVALYGIDIIYSEDFVVCAVGANGRIVFSWNPPVWSVRPTPTNQTLRGVSFGDAVDLWAVGENGTIVHSGDNGDSWQLQDSPVGTNLKAVSFANADTGYVAGDNGVVLFTANGGAPPNQPPGAFARMFPADNMLSDSMGLVKWSRSVDPEGDSVTYIVRVHTDYSYWLPPDTILEITTADTTLDLGIPFPLSPLDEIFHFWWRVFATDGQDTIEASNGEGMFLLDIIMSADSPFILPPSSFILTAYPNPFNPATTLSLSLPVSSEAILRVFDVTGRLVRETRLGMLTSGSHEIAFDGSDLPSGIYIAAIETPVARAMQKLVLLK